MSDNTLSVNEVPSRYNPESIEDRWYEYWLKNRHFQAATDPDKEPFTIMMPPPNVTGALHMGHALQGAVQDAIIRLRRMQGYQALWLPGTDHAGIATQNVVERELKKKERKTRHDVGREAFVNKVWEWKDKYGAIITRQYSKLGVSCDWSRERFTMDEGLSRAVQQTFIRLHEEGLIYKGNYLVNWCPVDMTAISDEEVDHVEQKGHMWHVSYPLDSETAARTGQTHLTIATTRPETIPADTAVSVHPDDERYKVLVGGFVIVPSTGRKVPVIADDYVKMDYGTGALKVTPAHDENDFEIGKRHALPVLNILNRDATLNEAAGPYAGMDRFEARKAILADLESEGLLVKAEEYVHQVGISSRSKAVIEPLLSDQWFVRMKPLAEKAMQASRSGEFGFYPARWENEFFRWMENIRDWVISRQLWWGHRIPVWYHTHEDGRIDYSRPYVVSIEQPEDSMVQDPDVLDTWFSSWLWPFSTLGWPENTEDYRYFYPTTLLVSGYDILFFWVSRMIMGGLHLTGKAPFRDIFLTGIVKDKQGRKMSKSLNNGIDPLEMIDKYGADTVRYCLIILCAQGQDIKLDPGKFEMGRNFANKLWNVFRFLNSHIARLPANAVNEYSNDHVLVDEELSLHDRWMVSRLQHTLNEVNEDIDRYRLNEALLKIYGLVWDDFCDWYIELIKPAPEQTMDARTAGRALVIFEDLLRLLHPFMPYITEEIWQRLRPRDPAQALIVSSWPIANEGLADKESESHFHSIRNMISAVRNIRAEMSVPDKQPVRVLVKPSSASLQQTFQQHASIFHKMLRLEEIAFDNQLQRPAASGSAVIDGQALFVPLEGIIDLQKEQERLNKEAQRLESFLASVRGKLANESFTQRAPAHVIENEQKKERDAMQNLEKVRAILADLAC